MLKTIQYSGLGIAMALVAAIVPAQAQSSLFYEQPNVGALHVKEAQLEAQLNNAYNMGLIDPLELANMHRDLDAIRVKEESYRMRGFTSGGYDRIADRLEIFQNDLNRRCTKENIAAIPVIQIQ